MTRCILSLALFLCIFIPFPSQICAKETDFFTKIDSLYQNSTTVRMGFVQKSVSQLFTKPLTSSGYITLQRPKKLRWEYQKPTVSGFIINDANGLQWTGAGTIDSLHTTPLSPVLQVIGQQMLLWLSGDKNQMSKDFSIQTTSTQHCTLTPLNPAMLEYIHSINLYLDDDLNFIQNIIVEEPSGNTTTIIFSQTEIDPALNSTAFTTP